MWHYENQVRKQGYNLITGIDEAGRGPLAGPVAAASVILPADCQIQGLNDSKKLSARRRNQLFEVILEKAVAIGIGMVFERVIDKVNILQATKIAMTDSVSSLECTPDFLLIDGNQKINSKIPQLTIVKGDTLSASIQAASIIAKVTRDRMMVHYHRDYPQYGFSKHKGYGTRDHLASIRKFGPCKIHRKTFKGVKEYCSR